MHQGALVSSDLCCTGAVTFTCIGYQCCGALMCVCVGGLSGPTPGEPACGPPARNVPHVQPCAKVPLSPNPPAVYVRATLPPCVDPPSCSLSPLLLLFHPRQVFLPAHGKLVTSSKDGSLRVWDLAGQRCSQVVTGFKAEVWSLDANTGTTRLVAGGWGLVHQGDAAGAWVGRGCGGGTGGRGRAGLHVLLIQACVRSSVTPLRRGRVGEE
jgi:hypothetical protein